MRLLRRVTRPASPAPRDPRPDERRRGRRRHQGRKLWEHVVGAAVGVGALSLGVAIFASQLAAPSHQQQLQAYISTHAQKLKVATTVPAPVVSGSPSPAASGAAAITVPAATGSTDVITRDGYGATAGLQTLEAEGTNYDWARIVMLDGGWPQSDANITVMTRWMRQENGANDWWNRNNPLNMGSGGFGSFDNLVTSAQATADLLHSNPGMSAVAAAFAAGDDTAATESAIWNSNWASGHYAYGAHWHYTPVDQVKAPTSAW